ncbi:MAG: methyltransferase domain-containing protein, partial [Actinobacteria bacterium]|nr:methyltransferase domain-containing protein [Actinomycetota bacterium]
RSLAGAGMVPVGIDLAPEAVRVASEAGVAAVGAAESLPLRPASLDGAIAECVLSLVPDKAAALGELHRVVREGGRIALSDVTLDGELPLPLDPLVSWSACVGGALGGWGYERLLGEAGFEDLTTVSLDHELGGLLEQVRRRLALAEMVVRAGGIDLDALRPGLRPEALKVGRDLISFGIEAIGDGVLGYKLFSATRA